jgi:hypothetical protein
MRLALLFFITLLWVPTAAFSQGFVSKINNSRQILARINDQKGFKADTMVMIVSAREGRVVAFGKVHDFKMQDLDIIAKIDITEIVDNSLIMVQDEVELLDFRNFERRKLPGFNSVTLKGNNKIPSQYKELAYMGVFSSDGHTLDKSEMLISPFQIQYGLNDDVGFKIVNALFLDGYANAGAKVRVANNKYAKITLNTFGAYKVQSQDWIGQFGGILTMPSNAKFQTHWMANFTFDPQFDDAHATKGLGLYQDSDIRSITEYITDSWNRVLYGPTYNVELQTFGGTMSYMWIWDSFHMSLGLATKNFVDFNFGTESYYYVYDFFWRF